MSNSKKNRITKRMLISIISSYQQCFDVKPPSKHFENLDILSTSTPKKRGISPCTGADDSLLSKIAKFRLEDSFSEPENTSYFFGGLLDSPSSSDINMLHINNKLTKRISPATKKTCLKELINNEDMSDVTINAFCVSKVSNYLFTMQLSRL